MPSGSRCVTQFSRKINAIRLFPAISPFSLLKCTCERQKIFLITGKRRSRYLGLLLFASQTLELFQSVFHFRREPAERSIVRALQTGKYG